MSEEMGVQNEELERCTMAVFVLGEDPLQPPYDIRLVIEGVLNVLPSVACAMLFGFIYILYALHLHYPCELDYTFDALEKYSWR